MGRDMHGRARANHLPHLHAPPVELGRLEQPSGPTPQVVDLWLVGARQGEHPPDGLSADELAQRPPLPEEIAQPLLGEYLVRTGRSLDGTLSVRLPEVDTGRWLDGDTVAFDKVVDEHREFGAGAIPG